MYTGKHLNTLFFPHDEKPDHFKALDGLRGVAIILVILSHTSGADLMIHPWLNFENFGKIGVYLFFVLSAYLLDRQISLALLNGQTSSKYWQNYFLRRFLRIFPLFIFALIVDYFLKLLGFYSPIDNIIEILKHIFLIKAESVFWSIPVEFKYYFISPLILYFCHRFLKWEKRLVYIFLFFIFLIAIFIQAFSPLSSPSTIRYLPIFLVGTFTSIFEILYFSKKRINNYSFFLNSVGAFAFVIILMTVPSFFYKIFNTKIDFLSAVFYVPYSILWAIVLFASKFGRGVVRKILEFKLLRFIGVISFSLYLFHMVFIDLSRNVNIPLFFRFYFVIISTLIFSSITYLCIERPLSKIKIYSNSLRYKNFQTDAKAVNNSN